MRSQGMGLARHDEVDALASELAARGGGGRRIAFVLGSGLGAVGERLARCTVIPAAELDHLPRPEVRGHAGTITLGELAGVPVLVQSGRVHLYEGRGSLEVTRAVRAFARLGARVLVLTNAAGGIEPGWPPGTLMLVTDHLDLQGGSPLSRGQGGRSRPYDGELGKALESAAAGLGVALERGVYAGLLGPGYETPAEIRALRALGASAVGMSTVAEACAGFAAGLRVVAVSCIANPAAGIGSEPLRHDDVLAAVGGAAETLGRIFTRVAPRWASSIRP